MAFLVDTNVMLRLAAPKDALHVAARKAVLALGDRGVTLATTNQNLVETWNVATRPTDKNGLGNTPTEAARLLRALERGFLRLADPPDTYERWREIVVRFAVSGVQVHDARLVAVMSAHGIMDILTFNARDFRRYTEMGIRATNPTES